MKKKNIENSIRITYKNKRIGGIRNEHGTKICRKIICACCSKIDYIYVHKCKENVFCRNCARKKLNLFGQSINIPKYKVVINCSKCGSSCDISFKIKKPLEWLCLDCLRGFNIWSGSIKNIKEKNKRVIEVHSSGTLLRKKI